MSEVITDPKMRKFVHSNITNDFGLSVNQVAEKCKSYGRFSAWLNSDVNRIKQVLNKVKENGVSPAFFASYERTEGYNPSWGWLNHTTVKGDPITDANYVSQWIVSQSKNTTDKPAWIDYANYNDFVPADVKQKGNADFANMKSGSIGKVIIAGTAAATWEVYYPLGLKKEYNGVQDYGAPINIMINTIEAWGGTIDGSNSDPDPPSINFKEIIEKLIEKLHGNLYNYGNKQTFGNTFFTVIQQMENTYKLRPNQALKDFIDDLFGFVLPDSDPGPGPFPPVSNYNNITAVYGYSDGYDGWHAGIDIGAITAGVDGDPIYATMDGTVRIAEFNYGGLGNVVWIEHSDDDYFSAYAHLSGFNTTSGSTVKKGDVIGYMGNTGYSFGTHLHFVIATVLWGNNESNTIDPKKYLGI